MAGNTSSVKLTVTYSAATSSSLNLAVTYPSQDIITNYLVMYLKGTVVDPQQQVKVTVTMDGQT